LRTGQAPFAAGIGHGPDQAEQLRAAHLALMPGYHLNKLRRNLL